MNIKSLRQELGLTQAQLARNAGISIKLLQKYESGVCKIENITLGTAIRLADALGIDVRALTK